VAEFRGNLKGFILTLKISEATMRWIILVLILMVSGGCVILPTGPSVPMSPATGKPFDLYLEEDGKCRQVAERQLGKYYDYFSTQEAQYHYDNVYVQCMHSHGNLLIQSPTVYRWYRIPRPPPQDYDDPPPD
jgi:hypothetical protein